MAEVYCASEPCPLFLNSTCVFYTGESLLYIGVQTNDTLEAIIVKINQAFQNTGIGYAFTNGVIQPTPSQPVQLGGALIQNTTIGGNFTLTFSGNVQAAKHITTGGSSSQFVKGDGTLDSTAYQPAANYITGLSGDVLASGPGVAAATLATVNFSSGTFGNGNTIPIVTVNSKGLVTNITPTPINLPPISLTFIGDVVGSGLTGSNITLLLQNVNPNPYNTITPLKFSVNGKGLVTSASPITASDIVNILGFNPSGTAGSSGTSGTTGTSGTSGVNGTSGIDGTFGTSGTSGTSGSSATSGTSGTSGSSGTAGTSGSTGTSGSSGTTGTSGSSGTTGTSGSSGTSGTTGTSGSSGTSGTTGTSGSSGLSGDRFKTTSTTTYTLQAPGNPGTLTVDPGLSYTVAQSIIIAYDANNHNEAEVTSYNSITGVINFVTFTLTGSGTYSSWFVNIDGASGGDGSSGSSGTSGTSATAGTSGTTGTSGSSGTSGTTGTSGSSGTSGTSATDGTGGTSGTSGSSATSGTSGTSGTSATSGTSGTSGSTPVNQITGSGTSGQVAYFTGTTTITGENNLFWDATNDRLGVGTNVPTSMLTVKANDTTIQQLRLEQDNATDGWGFLANRTTGTLNIDRYGVNATTNAFNILMTSGNVGIGIATPNEKLQVSGAISATGTATTAFASSSTMDFLSGATRFISRGGNNSTRGSYTFKIEAADGSLSIDSFAIDNGGAATFSSTVTTGNVLYVGSGGSGGGYWTWNASNSYLVGASGKTFYINANNTTVHNGLSIGPTGAATFSSSVRAQGDFFAASGTSTAASIRFWDANTGLYHPGSDALGIITSGTEKIRITSSGNVGIGTTSANASSGYKMLRINGATTGAEIVLAGAEVEYGYMYANAGNFVIDALASQPLRFRTGAQNRMEISSAGKVEMGNALVSGEILKVIGPSGADNYISAYSGSIHMFLDADATNQAGIVGTQSSHNLILRTAGTNKVWITPSGNVLIGTPTDDGSPLQVSGGTTQFAIFNSTNANGGTLTFRRSGTNLGHIGNSGVLGVGILDDLEVRSGISRALHLKTDGGQLTLASTGEATFSSSVTTGDVLRIGASGGGGGVWTWGGFDAYIYSPTGKNLWLSSGSSGTNGIKIATSGNVVIQNNKIYGSGDYLGAIWDSNGGNTTWTIGDTPANQTSWNLRVNTSAAKSGGGSWGDSSDGRLKKDIKTIENALDKINKLNPVTFEWINPSEHNNQYNIGGFIAQEIKEIFPQFVNQINAEGKDKDIVGINEKVYGLTLPFKFDAYIVKSIQELYEQIQELKQEIDLLKK